MCLSRGNSGLCSIYFVNNGQTAAGLINISFNSMVTLPLLKSSTVYNVHADVLFANVNLSFQLERIFTTEKCKYQHYDCVPANYFALQFLLG